MPIEDKTRSETVLANADNMLALASEAVDQVKAEALVSDDLRSILDRLLLTAQSLREQLHLLDQERRHTPRQT